MYQCDYFYLPMPFPVYLVFLADSFLGRVVKDSLPQQALMEMFAEGISNMDKIYGTFEDMNCIPDVVNWRGLTFNESGELIEIDWLYSLLEGSISLRWLSPSVKKVVLRSNSFNGSLDLDVLPEKLEVAYFSSNAFTGCANLKELPPNLSELAISFNQLSGEVCLTALPKTLKKLYLNKNLFSGPINLTSLPATMTYLNLARNDFSGETDFSALPLSFKMMCVSYTRLTGTAHVERQFDFDVKNSAVEVFNGIPEDESLIGDFFED